MGKVDPDEDVLGFAIAREVEANRFYLALARRVASSEIRKVFEELAEEELEHKARLELEFVKTGRVLPEGELVVLPEHEYIVSDTDAALDMDYKDILMLGIEKEDAAFRTYVDIVAQVRDEQTREVLLALAQEEVKHKLRFEAEYDMLLKKD